MPFDIRPVLMSDAEQWTKLMFDSFADDPISELLYPVPASPSLIEWSVHHILGEWGQNPTVRLMKIVETDTGNMVAGAQWMFLPEREGDEWTKGPDPSQLHHEYNKEAWTTISMTFREARHSIMGAQPYAYLITLATHPKYRRQGVATILLDWGIQQASAANLPIYLLAYPRGQALYLKKGFKAVCESPVYTDPSKTQVLRTNVCMILDAPDPSLPPKVSIINTVGKFFVEPVTLETDFLKLAEVEAAAFVEDRLIRLCFPRGSPDESEERGSQVLAFRGNSLFKDSQKKSESEPEWRFAKATDPVSEEIVAWASLRYSHPSSPDPTSKTDSADKGEGEGWSPAANAALCDHFFGELDRRRKAYMGEDTAYALVSDLATRPEYQRRGIGGQLLRWILERVDEKGYECWINASARGVELYKRFGWLEVGFVDLDLEKWGGKEGLVSRTVCLVRKSRGRGEREGGLDGGRKGVEGGNT